MTLPYLTRYTSPKRSRPRARLLGLVVAGQRGTQAFLVVATTRHLLLDGGGHLVAPPGEQEPRGGGRDDSRDHEAYQQRRVSRHRERYGEQNHENDHEQADAPDRELRRRRNPHVVTSPRSGPRSAECRRTRPLRKSNRRATHQAHPATAA